MALFSEEEILEYRKRMAKSNPETRPAVLHVNDVDMGFYDDSPYTSIDIMMKEPSDDLLKTDELLAKKRLDDVLMMLYSIEQNVNISSFFDERFQISLGDMINGWQEVREFDSISEGTAWLLEWYTKKILEVNRETK